MIVNAAAQDTTRGPGMMPLAMASLIATVMNPLPPKSLMVVTPDLIANRAFFMLSIIMSSSDALRNSVALRGLPELTRCTCASTNPGMMVLLLASITSTPSPGWRSA